MPTVREQAQVALAMAVAVAIGVVYHYYLDEDTLAWMLALQLLVWDYLMFTAALGHEPKFFGRRIPIVSFLLAFIFSELPFLLFQAIKYSFVSYSYMQGVLHSVEWVHRLVLPVAIGTSVIHLCLYVSNSFGARAVANIAISRFSRKGPLNSADDGDHSLENPLLLMVRRCLFLPQVLPFVFSLHIERDICYATKEEVQQAGAEASLLRLNVISSKKRAPSGQPLKPVLVYVHGGGWSKGLGGKDDNVIMPYYMAHQGWIVVSVDYRLWPTCVWPTYMVDCKRALRWVKQNIRAHGGDSDFIAVAGGSAGGHLASLLAVTGDPLQRRGVNQYTNSWQPGFEDMDLSVQACVAWYPAHDTSGEWWSKYTGEPFNEASHKSASPYHLVKNWMTSEAATPNQFRLCPFLVIQGGADSITPAHYVVEFYRMLREACRHAAVRSSGLMEYVEFPMAHHAFDQLSSPRSFYANAVAARFLTHALMEAQEESENQTCKVAETLEVVPSASKPQVATTQVCANATAPKPVTRGAREVGAEEDGKVVGIQAFQTRPNFLREWHNNDSVLGAAAAVASLIVLHQSKRWFFGAK